MRRLRGNGKKRREDHGESNNGTNPSPEYRVWAGLIRRCENPRDRNFGNYGGRGIRVCFQWRQSYRAFVADVGRRPSERHSIDRIDVNGNYEPGNVRWATKKVQARNVRNIRTVLVRGERITVAEAAERFATVSKSALFGRLRVGWGDEDAVLLPKGARRDCIDVPRERRRVT